MQTQNQNTNTTPRAPQNLVGTLKNNQSFAMFSNAVDKAGLNGALAGTTEHTVFAPTDAAFSKLPAGTMDRLLKPENKAELAELVNYHLVDGRRSTVDVGKWEAARTIGGQHAPIALSDNKLTIDGARVTSPDIAASNGMVHGIDKVNLPTKGKATGASKQQ